MEGIFCESSGIDMNVTEMRGVQYIVFSFFDGEERLVDRFGTMIQNSFESSNMLDVTNESLSDNGIAIDES